MSATLIRVESPAQVAAIAAANRVSRDDIEAMSSGMTVCMSPDQTVKYSRTEYAASVTLSDGVCYFWSAS